MVVWALEGRAARAPSLISVVLGAEEALLGESLMMTARLREAEGGAAVLDSKSRSRLRVGLEAEEVLQEAALMLWSLLVARRPVAQEIQQ